MTERSEAARVLVVTGVGALGVWLLWWLILTVPRDTMITDLYPAWIAARLWEAGQYADIYQGGVYVQQPQSAAWLALMDQNHIPREIGTTFSYNPVFLWLFGPLLRAVELRAASQWTMALNALAVAVIGGVCARLADLRRPAQILGLTAMVALSFPAITALKLGQDTLLCLAVGLLGLQLVRREDGGRWGGLGLLGLGCVLKPWFVAVFAVVWAMRRRREAVLGLVGWALLLVALPWALAPRAMSDAYATLNASLIRDTIIPLNNVSLLGHIVRLNVPEWPKALNIWLPVTPPAWILGLVGVLLAGLLVPGVLWLRRSPAPERVLVVGLVAMLLPLSVCWTHYLAFGWPLLAVASFHLNVSPRVRLIGLAGTLLQTAYVPHPLPTLLHDRGNLWRFQDFAFDHPILAAWQVELPLLVLLGVGAALMLSGDAAPPAPAGPPAATGPGAPLRNHSR